MLTLLKGIPKLFSIILITSTINSLESKMLIVISIFVFKFVRYTYSI